jgi:membrane-associated phospholipid phosphatase
MRTELSSFVRKRLDPAERYGLRVTLFALAVALVAVPFGFLLDQVVRHGGLVRIDTAAARSLHRAVYGHGGLIAFLKVLTFVGTPLWFFFIVTLAAAFLLWRGRRRLAIYVVVTSLVGGMIDSVVKILVDRPRPVLENPILHAHGKSFPSGHAMSSTVVYGALLLAFMPAIPRRYRRAVVAGVWFLLAGIGFSRLALGVHYMTDVLGGYVLGAAWLAASTAAFGIWREERGRKPAAPLTEGVEPEARKDLHVRS